MNFEDVRPYDTIKIDLDKGHVKFYWQGRVVADTHLRSKVFDDDSITLSRLHGFVLPLPEAEWS
jgi:uncharacterized protein (DUF427 family)